jgi:hypothetical protein
LSRVSNPTGAIGVEKHLPLSNRFHSTPRADGLALLHLPYEHPAIVVFDLVARRV